jgi:hypothetical protein
LVLGLYPVLFQTLPSARARRPAHQTPATVARADRLLVSVSERLLMRGDKTVLLALVPDPRRQTPCSAIACASCVSLERSCATTSRLLISRSATAWRWLAQKSASLQLLGAPCCKVLRADACSSSR